MLLVIIGNTSNVSYIGKITSSGGKIVTKGGGCIFLHTSLYKLSLFWFVCENKQLTIYSVGFIFFQITYHITWVYIISFLYERQTGELGIIKRLSIISIQIQ
jgi:hypothetical protein